ncbi:MAG: grasp-with-spasm system SPASM domain peptide maturase [Allosphingosinicella sp.]
MPDTASVLEPATAFRLFPTCKFVRGGAYSAVYDLERRRLYRFESGFAGLFELAASRGGIPLAEVGELAPAAQRKALEAIAYMREHEIGHEVDSFALRHVADMPEDWAIPQPIANAIVDVDDRAHDWPALIAALSGLQCDMLQVRGFSNLLDLAALDEIMAATARSSIAHVEAIMAWTAAHEATDWPALFARHRNLVRVQLHGAPEEKEINAGSAEAMTVRVVRWRKAPVGGCDSCGHIVEGSLQVPSVALYSELRAFNGCLNRKVSIRADGEICNCPSMRAGFGKDLTRLSAIVASPVFQRPWRLRKDDIEGCKGCEFRYVCTDCRAYLEDDASLAKPARCRYDPVTGIWRTSSLPIAEGAL